MKKSEIILAFIGFALVGAILFGVFGFLSNFEESTQKPSNTQFPSGSGDVYSEEPQFLPGTDLGWVTKGNVTTFFIAASAPTLLDEDSCQGEWTISFGRYYSTLYSIDGHSSISNSLKYSIDGAATWNDFELVTDADTYVMYEPGTIRMVYATKYSDIFIAFAEVNSCSDPRETLERYSEDFFSEKEPTMCGRCDGNYNCYSQFKWTAQHKGVSTSSGNGALG